MHSVALEEPYHIMYLDQSNRIIPMTCSNSNCLTVIIQVCMLSMLLCVHAGVAGFVVNSKGEVLVIQEKWLRNLDLIHWKFPGGVADSGRGGCGPAVLRRVHNMMQCKLCLGGSRGRHLRSFNIGIIFLHRIANRKGDLLRHYYCEVAFAYNQNHFIGVTTYIININVYR